MLMLEDKVSKFINEIEEWHNPLYIDRERDYVENEEDIIGIAETYFGTNVSASWGVSKYVIIPKTANYVIKMPFEGEVIIIEEEYDSELCTYVTLDEVDIDYDDYDTNYCEIELNVYNKAKQNKLDKLFAETKKIKDGFYLQEKIKKIGAEYGTSSYSEETSSKASSMISSSQRCSRLSSKWLSCVIETYGEIMAQAFIDFCDENYINDLHSGNIGYRDNGEPVLIDYSGYFS